MAATHLLFETAAGLALFESKFHDEIAQSSKHVQEQITDLTKFGQMVSLKSFAPFNDAAQALQCANDISEGVLNEHLRALLELNLPSKKKSVILGISDRSLGQAIKSELTVDCDTSTRTMELLRGIRLHAEKLLGGFEKGDIVKSQLGLGHAYSRAKVKFNVNRSDNMIIQAISLLDQLDKDVNTFSMRIREWYGWHFPELVKIVPENYKYAQVVKIVGDKASLSEDKLEEIASVLNDDDSLARNVLDAARSSMGTQISPVDLINISTFADRVINLFAYRKSLQDYLREKMGLVAPNLRELLGDTIAARLISHAGSLTNLSKYPASTVQILGAEKALFRALKTKGNTPKYGLLYHSPFIGRAGLKNKGRISRYLANKSSIAARIDNFSESPSMKYGEALRRQVEERLSFYETGSNPTKNATVMMEVSEALLRGDDDDDEDEEVEIKEDKKSKKKKQKRKSEAAEDENASGKRSKVDGDADVSMADISMMTEDGSSDKKQKKKDKKKEKKDKKAAAAEEETMDVDEAADEKKKKKKEKKQKEEEAVSDVKEDSSKKSKKKRKSEV